MRTAECELMEQLRSSDGFEQVTGFAGRRCDAEVWRIVVDADFVGNAQTRFLVHELAQALGAGYCEFGRERVGCSSTGRPFIVCGSVGLDISGGAASHVAGWGKDGALDVATFGAG